MKVSALACAILLTEPLSVGAAQQCNAEAFEAQERHVEKDAEIVLGNFVTAWNLKLPGRVMKFDHGPERVRSWNPMLSDAQKNAVAINTGLGCITFVPTKDASQKLPDLCAPIDARLQMIMEAVREAYLNSRDIEDPVIKVFHEQFSEMFGEEKVVFCMLHSNGASYIGLGGKWESCAN